MCHNKSGEAETLARRRENFFAFVIKIILIINFALESAYYANRPRGFCLWKFSFNTLIACGLLFAFINLKFLEYFRLLCLVCVVHS